MSDSLIETRYLPAALQALKAFPIQLEDIQSICHSENVTFRIIPRDSQTHYALRLHRPGYNSLAELNEVLFPTIRSGSYGPENMISSDSVRQVKILSTENPKP